MPSFKVIVGLLVPEKKIFKDFLAIYSSGGRLGHVNWTMYTNFHSLFQRSCLNILVIYMYTAPSQGQTTPLAQNIFININLLSICSFLESFLPLNDISYFFPFKCMGDLSWPCRQKGQGHPRVMIYTNFVELHCLMLHAKFQNHRPSGSGEEDF